MCTGCGTSSNIKISRYNNAQQDQKKEQTVEMEPFEIEGDDDHVYVLRETTPSKNAAPVR